MWDFQDEAKVFNPNIWSVAILLVIHISWKAIVSIVHRQEKFVETTHGVFLEDKMVWVNMVPREIGFEEKHV